MKNTVRNGAVSFAAAVASGAVAYAFRGDAYDAFGAVAFLAALFGFLGSMASQEL